MAAGKAKTKRVAAAKGARAKTLSGSEQRFVDEYLIDFNGTRAYQAAYPAVAKTSARACAYKLLTKDHIQAAIAEGARRTAAKLELTRERILRETARIAFFDPRKLFHADGTPKEVTELDDDTAGAIAGIEVIEELADGERDERQAHGGSLKRRQRGPVIGYVKKYKVADKNSALERGARFLAMFKEDNEQRADPLRELLKAMGRSSFPIARDDDE
jgi:phage terminase small subunit